MTRGVFAVSVRSSNYATRTAIATVNAVVHV